MNNFLLQGLINLVTQKCLLCLYCLGKDKQNKNKSTIIYLHIHPSTSYNSISIIYFVVILEFRTELRKLIELHVIFL
jgi:hypothetical protein